jgi:hypothetical protein
MPNHVTNKLVITGSDEQINDFVSKVNVKTEDGGNDGFDFNSLIPTPAELKDTTAPSDVVPDDQYASLVAEGTPLYGKISQSRADHLMKTYGVTDWYDWCVANWGTKWGAYDVTDWNVFKNEAFVTFNTAWSPPTEFLINASKLYPNLQFKNTFCDEGGSFLGWEIISDGEKVDEAVYRYDDIVDGDDEPLAILEELGMEYLAELETEEED